MELTRFRDPTFESVIAQLPVTRAVNSCTLIAFDRLFNRSVVLYEF